MKRLRGLVVEVAVLLGKFLLVWAGAIVVAVLMGLLAVLLDWVREHASEAQTFALKVLVACVTVGIGFGLFTLKRSQLRLYARLEGIFALGVILDTLRFAKTTDVTTGLKLSGAIYLVVRALDNAATAKANAAPIDAVSQRSASGSG